MPLVRCVDFRRGTEAANTTAIAGITSGVVRRSDSSWSVRKRVETSPWRKAGCETTRRSQEMFVFVPRMT